MIRHATEELQNFIYRLKMFINKGNVNAETLFPALSCREGSGCRLALALSDTCTSASDLTCSLFYFYFVLFIDFLFFFV